MVKMPSHIPIVLNHDETQFISTKKTLSVSCLEIKVKKATSEVVFFCQECAKDLSHCGRHKITAVFVYASNKPKQEILTFIPIAAN